MKHFNLQRYPSRRYAGTQKIKDQIFNRLPAGAKLGAELITKFLIINSPQNSPQFRQLRRKRISGAWKFIAARRDVTFAHTSCISSSFRPGDKGRSMDLDRRIGFDLSGRYVPHPLPSEPRAIKNKKEKKRNNMCDLSGMILRRVRGDTSMKLSTKSPTCEGDFWTMVWF